MTKRSLLLILLLGLLVLTACGGSAPEEMIVEETGDAAIEPVQEGSDVAEEVVEEVEVVKEVEVEVAKEVEVEQEPAIEEPVSEESMSDEMMEEDSGFENDGQTQNPSIGQEGAAQATPVPPRDKTGANNGTADDEAVAAANTDDGAVRSVDTSTESQSPRPEFTPTPQATIEPDETQQLSAGVVDDNQQFDAYLDYLEQYAGPQVELVDVSLRHRFVVVDAFENPLQGATITIYDNDLGTVAHTLRTHADGGAWFFPHTVSEQVPSSYDIEVTYGMGIAYADSFTPNGNNTLQTIVVEEPEGGAFFIDIILQLDILLLLDATGSMGDEIAELKASIQSIAERTLELPGNPELRFGMVAYRDQGEAFVTRVVDFSYDYATFETELNAVQALGGGDYPEDLNQALDDALNAVSWSDEAIPLVFLVADAPPHLDYGQENHYAVSALTAAQRGTKIFPIASSGLDQQGEYIFRQIAQLTGSQFIFLVDGVDEERGADDDASSGETSFSVDEYTVGSLDDVVMAIIERELAFQGPR